MFLRYSYALAIAGKCSTRAWHIIKISYLSLHTKLLLDIRIYCSEWIPRGTRRNVTWSVDVWTDFPGVKVHIGVYHRPDSAWTLRILVTHRCVCRVVNHFAYLPKQRLKRMRSNVLAKRSDVSITRRACVLSSTSHSFIGNALTAYCR